jgi:anthranilate phosphoribosyltransferase
MEYPSLLRRLIAGTHLSQSEAAGVIGAIVDGEFTPSMSAGLLVALASKGEHLDEIVGAARAMRERCLRVDHGCSGVVDVVGTGGDGANTMNVSTMAALVVAAAGLPVAKHGNRAASSACGSADVLEATGLRLDLDPERTAAMLRDVGFAFMYAPRYHPAMKNVAPIRRELGVKTIFNVLGPLTNPASADVQIIGVARPELVQSLAAVLPALGVRRGAVVYGRSGIDEIAGDQPSTVVAFDESGTREWTLEPADFAVATPLEEIVVASVPDAAAAFTSILGGERSRRADVVALNAALVLHVAQANVSMHEAFSRAQSILASGEALHVYERAKEFSAHA